MRLIRLTMGRQLKMGAHGWGALFSYVIDSIKINNDHGKIRSTAIIKVVDQAGAVTVMFQGNQVATLLGFTPKQWSAIEEMSSACQLFYRSFQHGLKDGFAPQQELFYTLCENLQRRETLFLKFERVPNIRKGEETIAFLKVLQCSLPTPEIMKQFNFNNTTDLIE